MATHETPGEAPESTSEYSSSLPIQSSGKPSFINKWFLIGGGAGVVLIVIIIAVALKLVLGGGLPMPDSTLELVPEDTGVIIIWDIPAIMLDEYHQEYGIPVKGFLNEDLNLDGDTRILDVEIDFEEVDEYILAIIDSEVLLLKGAFQFEDTRDDLMDAGYEKNSYRGYEIWEGWTNYAPAPVVIDGNIPFWDGWMNYALIEKGATGYIIVSPSEDAVEGVLNNLYRGSGSLTDGEDSDLKRILEKLGEAPTVVASVDDPCKAIKRCQGYGSAFTGYDVAAEKINSDFVLLFSSERAAETAADDYDEVADFIELGVGFDIADTKSEGEFVISSGTAETR